MKKYLVLFALILIQGCSSGGGDSTAPIVPDTVFQLFEAGSFTDGFKETWNVTGTDTAGGVWSGVFDEEVQAEVTYDSQPAMPILTLVQLTESSSNGKIDNLNVDFWSTSASDRRFLGSNDLISGTMTVSATTAAIPETAKIGDSGAVGTYLDSAGSVEVISWRLDDGGNGQAKVVQLVTEKDQAGILVSSSTTTTLIDTSGNAISKTLEIYTADTGVTLTLFLNK